MIVKATEDIKESEEIFRSYSTAVSSHDGLYMAIAHEGARKGMLKELCFLDCKCKACANPRLTVVNIEQTISTNLF